MGPLTSLLTDHPAKATITIGALARKIAAVIIVKIVEAVLVAAKVVTLTNRNNSNPPQPTPITTTNPTPLPHSRIRIIMEEVVKTVVVTRTITTTIECDSRAATIDRMVVDKTTTARGVRTHTMVVAHRTIIQITTIEAKDPMVIKILEVEATITIKITHRTAVVEVCLPMAVTPRVTMVQIATTTTWIPTVAVLLVRTRRLNDSTLVVAQTMTVKKARQPLADTKTILAVVACQ